MKIFSFIKNFILEFSKYSTKIHHQYLTPSNMATIHEFNRHCQSIIDKQIVVEQPKAPSVTDPTPKSVDPKTVSGASMGVVDNPSFICKTFYKALVDEKMINPGIMVDRVANMANVFQIDSHCVNPSPKKDDQDVVRFSARYVFQKADDVARCAAQMVACLQKQMNTVQ